MSDIVVDGRGIHMSGAIEAGAPGAGLGGGGGLSFLLRADFNTPAAAPLGSPYPVEVGSLAVITDTNNKLSVAGGKLTFATGGVGAGDPGAWGTQLARLAGRAVVAKVRGTSPNVGIEVGWDGAQAGSIQDCIRFLFDATSTIRVGGTSVVVDTFVAATDYSVAVVMRDTGILYLIKGGVFANWTLVYVSNTGNAVAYAASTVTATTSVATLDNLRVLDLPAPFTTDYGLATQRLAGAQSAGQTFTHEANCVIEYVVTTLPSASEIRVDFRFQDINNYWRVAVTSDGSFQLLELVAGSATLRGNVATIVSNGHRVVIVADGTTIRGYSNNVLRWTYSSATNFATATAGKVELLGTGGAVSEIISWPRTLPAAAALLLDQAVA